MGATVLRLGRKFHLHMSLYLYIGAGIRTYINKAFSSSSLNVNKEGSYRGTKVDKFV
jgi:hypothetical protein